MSLINPNDTIERQNEKLLQITQSLMRRVEQKNEQSGLAYQQFERAALLESEVRQRTQDLERTLDLLQESNARLEIANSETEKARSNLTEAIETINEGFALFEEDDGLILSNSRFCRDLLDIEGGLVAGLRFSDYVRLVSESSYLSLPEGETPAQWALQRLSKHGDDHVVFNVRLKWDRWLQVSEHRTSRGGTVILQTDVTSIIRRERRERDKLRNAQAEMLQATLDHLNQGVCIFDVSRSLVGWNSRMDGIFSLPRDQTTLGISFNSLLDLLKNDLVFEGEIDAAFLKNWANRPKDRDPIGFEVSRGPSQTLSVFAQEMPDQGFVISFTDVTAERAAARTLSDMNEILERRVEDRTHELGLALEEAERANASKSRFVAAASHDLLQPLSAAKLFVSSLAEQVDTEATNRVVEKADTALKSVEQFISALLDISKLDAGKAVFDVQPLQLSQIFKPLRDELAPLAAQKGIELRIVDCGLSVVSDPGYMRRIVQNLLSNAIRYTEKGRVLMGVRRICDTARIEIWDTGCGIAANDQATIFKEFERISPNTSDTGLGLGLSIVERACKGLDHDLTLTSELDKGSCFTVTVPIYSDQSSGKLQSPNRIETPLQDQVFMLVVSDPPLQTDLSQMLERLGATLIQADSAPEAMALLQEIELVPDTLLIGADLATEKDGFQFYDEFRNTYGAVPTGILTSEVTTALASICAEMGLHPLEVPTTLQHLTDHLRAIRSSYRASEHDHFVKEAQL